MISIYDGYSVMNCGGKTTYFAGANTAGGFVGSYGDIADERKLDRVYIIKGGSGTGKSSTMRKIAWAAEELGFNVEYYLCGSDPESLDCVVIDGRIAILDGTAPHTRDMTYPGAKSELIDISKCWKTSLLEEQKNRIVYRSAMKSAEYASVYRYLGSAEIIEREKREVSSKVFLKEKAFAYIGRFIKKLGHTRASSAAVDHRYTHGLTMRGAYCVNTVYASAKEHYVVSDTLGCAALFMEMLTEALTDAGYKLTVGHLPISDSISGVLIHDVGVSVTVQDLVSSADKRINMARFADKDRISAEKGRYKLAAKCQAECISEALDALRKAAEHHFVLENIYKPAMDFALLNEMTDNVVKDVLARLDKK